LDVRENVGDLAFVVREALKQCACERTMFAGRVICKLARAGGERHKRALRSFDVGKSRAATPTRPIVRIERSSCATLKRVFLTGVNECDGDTGAIDHALKDVTEEERTPMHMIFKFNPCIHGKQIVLPPNIGAMTRKVEKGRGAALHLNAKGIQSVFHGATVQILPDTDVPAHAL